jgi:hypothetical protein
VGDEEVAKSLFHKAPRAALSTLRYHNPQSTDSWLRKRDPTLNLKEEGLYTQDDENPSAYRKINANDTPWIRKPIKAAELATDKPSLEIASTPTAPSS